MTTKSVRSKDIVLSDRDIERQALILLKNIYSERLLHINLMIAEIDKSSSNS